MAEPRTWTDLAVAAGAAPESAEDFLWAGSAFPFAPPRVVYEQIRHTVRHGQCFDQPDSTCNNRRVRRAMRSTRAARPAPKEGQE